MYSVFRILDFAALVGRGSAPRPRRPGTAETLFIGVDEAVAAYKSLARVKQAFRPIFVCAEAHVRAHVPLCMLAATPNGT